MQKPRRPSRETVSCPKCRHAFKGTPQAVRAELSQSRQDAERLYLALAGVKSALEGGPATAAMLAMNEALSAYEASKPTTDKGE